MPYESRQLPDFVFVAVVAVSGCRSTTPGPLATYVSATPTSSATDVQMHLRAAADSMAQAADAAVPIKKPIMLLPSTNFLSRSIHSSKSLPGRMSCLNAGVSAGWRRCNAARADPRADSSRTEGSQARAPFECRDYGELQHKVAVLSIIALAPVPSAPASKLLCTICCSSVLR